MSDFRIEKDSMGEVKVPPDALYCAQTQRAVENFPISGLRFPRVFIRALGTIKKAAATINAKVGAIDPRIAKAIVAAADEVIAGKLDAHFPIDIFQTGSGTSTNMNANEVIATRATQILNAKGAKKNPVKIHPNDHVNNGQSSNDIIPTTIHVAAMIEVAEILLPGLARLAEVLEKRAEELKDVVKTGRTHLMDAMPVTFGQELGGWAHQIRLGIKRVQNVLPELARLPIGGTAVGTGINARPGFAASVAAEVGRLTGLHFEESDNHFSAQSSMDTPTELSAMLKTTATALMKIANDLRWMNSGPIAGLGEIALPSLQPGSSIMPGKVNPVICEALMMACAQVIGNDLAVAIGNERGNFQLNVMLPVIARNLLESITILGNAARVLADKAIAGFTVNREHVADLLDKNPILVTSLNPVIGYDKAAKLAKQAYAEKRRLKDLVVEQTDLSMAQAEKLLDPAKMTKGGIME
jgi:fumarate hydratase class II